MIIESKQKKVGKALKPNMSYYIQKINVIVQRIEEIGEEMNPHYEEIRTAIDEKKEAKLNKDKLEEIKKLFQKGTDEYQKLFKESVELKAPIKVIGIHKKFENAFQDYINGCKEMLSAIDETEGIDVKKFDSSESKQDKATDEITFAITRMSNILLK